MNHDRAQISRVLGGLGLGQLNDPGLPAQLGYFVQDHDHFRQLLNKCAPEHRTQMYEALRPHLRFEAKPLDVYMSENASLAERQQLPVITEDGKLRPYSPPVVGAVQFAVEEAVAKGHLSLVCRKCTREEVFSGIDRADAIRKARNEGWTYNELKGDGREICPKCPA